MAATPAENKMSYARLGKSGLKVSRIILGCMTYGTQKDQSWTLDEEESIKHIKTAYDLGINTFDTADMYSNGCSEIVLGKAIKQHNLPRDELVIMTKFSHAYHKDPNGPKFVLKSPEELDKMRFTNQYGASRKHIFDAVMLSLERLGLDYIDVYQLHIFDPNTPIEETMHALHDVVKAGYVRYIGMSSCRAWQFAKMQMYARMNSLRNFHNATYREEEREMVPLLQDLGVGMIPFSPLSRGFLSRPYEQRRSSARSSGGDLGFGFNMAVDPSKESVFIEINKRVEDIAKKRQVSMAQVAVAWTLSKPYVTAPIVGTSRLEQLKDLVESIHLKLTDEELASIDNAYQPLAAMPFW